MTLPLNHRCLSGGECVAQTPDGAAVTPRPDTLCSGCVNDIQRRLGELPHLAQALKSSFLAATNQVVFTSKVHSTPQPQSPLNVAVYDLINEIWDVIDRAGGPTFRIDNLVRAPAAEFLLWRKGGRVRLPLSGVQRALDVRRVHVKCEKRVGFGRAWQRRAAPCPLCELPTLGSWSGSDTISCANDGCSATFTRDEYDRHCFEVAKRDKMTTTEKA